MKDMGLIESGLKEKVREISLERNERLNETVSRVFVAGLSYYAVSEDSIPRLEPEDLVDDNLSYRGWQLDLYDDISSQYPGIEWSEVKSAFLRKGLQQIN